MNKKSVSFDLTWIILLFVVLKVTGVVHFSWVWILIPLGLCLFISFLGAILGVLGAALATYILTKKVK